MRKVRAAFLLLLFSATLAHADSATLSLNFAPPSLHPGDPCFGTVCTLNGTAQFYVTITGINIAPTTNPFGAPISVNALAAGQSFSATFFYPGDPCFGQNLTCTLGISFNGTTTPPNPITPPSPIFPTFFFFANNIPNSAPNAPPILPLGELVSNLTPPSPISQSGLMVGYDAAFTAGSWNVTTPEPASALLVSCGITMVGFLRRRKISAK